MSIPVPTFVAKVKCSLFWDIEQIPLTGKFDLIVSASTFQWLARPRATFAKLAAHLNTNGWLIFSTFGKNNFKELKAVTGQGLEYRSIVELSAWLSSEYDILYTEEQIHMLKFSDPLDILRHVKKTGVNATSFTDSLDQRTSSRVL